MQFELTEQQRMIRDMARDFAQREVAPVAAENDVNERFPAEVVQKMGVKVFTAIGQAEFEHALEVIDLALGVGVLDMSATPEVMERLLKVMRTMFDFVIIDGGQSLDSIALKILDFAYIYAQ